MPYGRSGYSNRRNHRKYTPRIKPVYVSLKGDVPRAVERYENPVAMPGSVFSVEELRRIYQGWKGQKVELYGRIIKGYGSELPYCEDHISCRLIGHTAYSVVNLDEIIENVDFDSLPSQPIG